METWKDSQMRDHDASIIHTDREMRPDIRADVIMASQTPVTNGPWAHNLDYTQLHSPLTASGPLNIVSPNRNSIHKGRPSNKAERGPKCSATRKGVVPVGPLRRSERLRAKGDSLREKNIILKPHTQAANISKSRRAAKNAHRKALAN